MTLLRTLAWAWALSAVAAGLARADESFMPGAETESWTLGGRQLTVSIAPFYAWIPGVRGDVRALGAPAEIEISPGDVLGDLSSYLDSLEGTYIGMGELRLGDFGLMYDVFYADYLSGTTVENRLFSVDVDVSFEQILLTVAGTYRLVDHPKGHLDALAGIRYQDIDLTVGLTLDRIIIGDLEDGASWVDPILGAKGRYNLTKRFFVQGWGMIGGFGARSDLLADGLGLVGYDVARWIDVWAGYRAAYTDFSSGGFEWEVTMHGPVLGFNLRF